MSTGCYRMAQHSGCLLRSTHARHAERGRRHAHATSGMDVRLGGSPLFADVVGEGDTGTQRDVSKVSWFLFSQVYVTTRHMV